MLACQGGDLCIYGGVAIFMNEQHLVGVEAISHFHARTADRHAGNRQADGACWRFCKISMDELRRDVAFENEALFGNTRVAGLMLRRDAMSGFLCTEVVGMVNRHCKGLIIQMRDPVLATAAGGTFENIQLDRTFFCRDIARVSIRGAAAGQDDGGDYSEPYN